MSDFKVGDQVYVVEGDFKGHEVQKVVDVTDDSEMPVVVEMGRNSGSLVIVRAFRPSELRKYIDVNEVEYQALFLEAIDEYNVNGDRDALKDAIVDLIDDIRFLAVCGDKARIHR